MLHRSLDLFTVVATGKGLHLNVEVEPQAHMHLIGDSLRISQIINNLLSNAIKFTEKGAIKLKVDYLGADNNLTELRFTVSDTGIGMTEEQLQHVLLPFIQADMGTTRKYGGSGLGLPICMSLLKHMGSHLNISSEKGRGSTFSFDLKLGHSPSARRYSDLSLNAQHMLLISDDLELQGLIGQYLLNWGVHLKTLEFDAATTELLGKINCGDFTLLLIDITTPGHVDQIVRCCQQWMIHNARDEILVLDRFGLSHDSRFEEISPIFVPYPMTPSRLFDCLSLRRKHSLAMGVSPMELARRITAHLRGIHVLLAEDVYSNQIIALDFLQQLGITTDVVENGLEAVEMVSKHTYDAVLMDFHMPMMDGLEASRIIREQFSIEQLPIIAMTAAAFERDKRLAEAAGMNAHVSKPINFIELATALSTYVHVRSQELTAADVPPQNAAQEASQLPDFGSLATHIDLHEVSSHFAHNPLLYVECIKSFVNDFGDWGETTEAYVHAGNFTTARQITHKLKGAAASLYAEKVAGLAKHLQLELEQQQSTSFTPLKTRLQLFIQDAHAFLQRHETTVQETHTGGIGELRSHLQQLDNMLKKQMFVPDIQLDQLFMQVPDSIDAQLLNALKRSISNFRFDESRDLLAKILADL